MPLAFGSFKYNTTFCFRLFLLFSSARLGKYRYGTKKAQEKEKYQSAFFQWKEGYGLV